MTAKPWRLVEYSARAFPFPELVGESLAVGEPANVVARVAGRTLLPLASLHGDGPRWTWRTDQSSVWHRRFYDGFESWEPTFEKFVSQVIAPEVDEPFYYQRVPTFRVHLPGNVAVGSFHTDARYHHPPGEITFWVPLTSAYDTSSVWIEDDDGVLQAPDVYPGQVVVFSSVSRVHGNRANTTGRARVSFDFRCLPTRLLPAEPGRTQHTRMRFAPGGYYADKIIIP